LEHWKGRGRKDQQLLYLFNSRLKGGAKVTFFHEIATTCLLNQSSMNKGISKLSQPSAEKWIRVQELKRKIFLCQIHELGGNDIQIRATCMPVV